MHKSKVLCVVYFIFALFYVSQKFSVTVFVLKCSFHFWTFQLIAYLHTENLIMREAGLILLQQCCNDGTNVQVLIELGVLNDLTLIITSRDCKPVHAIALDALRKVSQLCKRFCNVSFDWE